MMGRSGILFILLSVLVLHPTIILGRSMSVQDSAPSDSVTVEVDGSAVDPPMSEADSPKVRTEILRVLRLGEATLLENYLNTAKAYFEKRLEGSNAAENMYELARVHFAMSVMHKLRNEPKQGRQELEEALKWAKAADKADDSSAKVHTLLADLWGERLVEYGGLFAGPHFGPKVKAENEKAMAIAPDDPSVLAGLGRQYLLAPRAFGGSPEKAIELFKRALQLEPRSDATYVWLARAYRKLKNRDGFNDALANALRLQPENAQAKWEQSQWPEGKD
jgi:tetratricopeptide (TPR) repeat protein